MVTAHVNSLNALAMCSAGGLGRALIREVLCASAEVGTDAAVSRWERIDKEGWGEDMNF